MAFDHYEPDTIERIGDQVAGYQVHTGNLSGLTYWHQDQWEIFNVFGVVKVLNLFAEQLVVDGGPGATILQFNFTSTLPAPGIGLQVISGDSLTLATLVVGSRVCWLGNTVATLPVLTPPGPAGGISDFSCVVPMVLGAVGGTGTIGFVTTIADATAGTHRWSIFYLPMTKGSYVTAVL